MGWLFVYLRRSISRLSLFNTAIGALRSLRIRQVAILCLTANPLAEGLPSVLFLFNALIKLTNL